MINFKNKQIVVMGLAKSGIAAANLLTMRGANVKISESKKKQEIGKSFNSLISAVVCEFGGHTEEFVCQADLVVVSPGIPLDIPVLVSVRKAGIPIMSEIELGYQCLSSQKIVAITGTNGKTTTTTLIGEILKTADYKVVVAGNVGFPLCEAIVQGMIDNKTILILETSSFQLEAIYRFKPDIAVLLNLTFDHLDHHRSFAEYLQAKKRIFENQTDDDFMVINIDDLAVMELSKTSLSKPVCFSQQQGIKNGAWIENGQIKAEFEEKQIKICGVDELKIKGSHNLENTLASICVGLILRIEPKVLKEALMNFRGVEHRLEEVAEIEGVKFINDSKATNVDSVLCALRSFTQPIILIAGGRDKNSDYTQLNEILNKKCKALILLGEAAPKIQQAVSFDRDIINVCTLDEAVKVGFQNAKKGDIVLLSPGCSSYDMFSNFEERGQIFKKIVYGLS